MKVITVLSHLMSKEGILSDDSIKRAKLAIKFFEKGSYEFLITNGWAYRKDSDKNIANVIANYIYFNSKIEKKLIVSEVNSRDTVGDAFYLLVKLLKIGCTELTVVTSDYHAKRARIIFEAIFNNRLDIKVVEAKTLLSKNVDTLKHEANSIKAFRKTFRNIDFANIESIFERLTSSHPFYNGDIYPKVKSYNSVDCNTII